MRFLDGIQLLLLISRQQRPDLRQRAVDDSFCFLHRLLMNGSELRFGRIDNRLKLCLLIRGQIQLLRDSLKAVAVAASTATGPRLCLYVDKPDKRDLTRSYAR